MCIRDSYLSCACTEIYLFLGELFCVKDGEVRDRIGTFYEITPLKLVCELYGPVKQIRAFVGPLKGKQGKEIFPVFLYSVEKSNNEF